MVVITTTGAKSGAKRENPLIRLEDGGKMYIIASKGGAPDNPDWYYNLLANPELTVETGDETFAARAKVVEDEAERRRLYDKMISRDGQLRGVREEHDPADPGRRAHAGLDAPNRHLCVAWRRRGARCRGA